MGHQALTSGRGVGGLRRYGAPSVNLRYVRGIRKYGTPSIGIEVRGL